MPVILAFEGIDSCGKTTQAEKLAEFLRQFSFLVGVVSYPAYEGFIGNEIGKFLSAVEGNSLKQIDVKSTALWFAADRLEDFSKRYMYLSTMDYIIFNRWTMSNKAFQGARAEDPDQIIDWIDELEHKVLMLPRPNMYLLLDAPVEDARINTGKKGSRIYTAVADEYERDKPLQQKVREMYQHVAYRDATRTAMIPYGTPDSVHGAVLEALSNARLIPTIPTFKLGLDIR